MSCVFWRGHGEAGSCEVLYVYYHYHRYQFVIFIFFIQASDVKGAAAGAIQDAKSNIDSAVSDFIGQF